MLQALDRLLDDRQHLESGGIRGRPPRMAVASGPDQMHCGPIQSVHRRVDLPHPGLRERINDCLISPLQFFTTLLQIEQAKRMRGFLTLQHLAGSPGQIDHHSCLLVDHAEEVGGLGRKSRRADSLNNFRNGDGCHGIHLFSASRRAGGRVITTRWFGQRERLDYSALPTWIKHKSGHTAVVLYYRLKATTWMLNTGLSGRTPGCNKTLAPNPQIPESAPCLCFNTET